MLVSLHVKNLALIDEAEVYFSEGLNILTGETGAGKSILIGSINLALGGQAAKNLIRDPDQPALVELVFEVTNPDSLKKLQELDLYPEDGGLFILSRKLVNGRSIGKVNGEIVSAGVLKQIAEILINIHGQHEHQSLLYKKKHLEILDDYGSKEISPQKVKVREAYAAYSELKETYDATGMDEEQRTREISFLNFEIREIEDAALKDGEDEELESRYRKMVNARKILEAVTMADGLTGAMEETGAQETIGRAVRELHTVATFDEKIQSLSMQLQEVENLLNDFHRELSDYAQELCFSQEDFQNAEERLDTINHLKSKYGQSIRQILEYQAAQQEKLEKLVDYEQYRQKLAEKLQQSEAVLKKTTDLLSVLRSKYAGQLGRQIRSALMDLNFLDVLFHIEMTPLGHFTANGGDEAEFMISTNPGEKERPLAQVASGGELSRIMLAIKTVMADQDATETLIFDEIDTGISGRTAQKVSEKLAFVAKGHQVICITHLAQIAAMADAHFAIEKNVKNKETITTIRKLNDSEMVQELARILGGAEITETVLKNAKEMKELAIGTKSS